MYAYDELDRTLLNERVSEFRDQVKRRLSGELTEDEAKQRTVAGTRRFARKQLGWFRRDPRIRWLPADEPGLPEWIVAQLPAAG